MRQQRELEAQRGTSTSARSALFVVGTWLIAAQITACETSHTASNSNTNWLSCETSADCGSADLVCKNRSCVSAAPLSDAARTQTGSDAASEVMTSTPTSNPTPIDAAVEIGIDAGPDFRTDPQKCSATCDTSAGTVYTFSTVEEVLGALVGRWQICDGRGGTYPGPADVAGVEYGPPSRALDANGDVTIGGNMYYLVAGASGLVRGKGFEYQLTYQVVVEAPRVTLYMQTSTGGGFGGDIAYSPCPTQFEVSGGSPAPGSRAILVPDPSAPGASDDHVSNEGQPGSAQCTATCDTPAGTLHAFSSLDDLFGALAGQWRICASAGSAVSAPSDAIGVEFGPVSQQSRPDGPVLIGSMYYLVAGNSGPVRGSGFDHQLTYEAEVGSGAQVIMHPATGGGFGGGIAYSSCPTEFKFESGIDGSSTVLVRFD